MIHRVVDVLSWIMRNSMVVVSKLQLGMIRLLEVMVLGMEVQVTLVPNSMEAQSTLQMAPVCIFR